MPTARDVSGEGTSGGTRLAPPSARKHRQTSVHHGIVRHDDYGWLRAENWQQVTRDASLLAPEIRGYLEAENTYAAAAMADVEV